MRWRSYSTACVAVALGAVAALGSANAATVSLVSDVGSSTPSTAASSFVTSPIAETGNFVLNQTGTIANQSLSPFVNQSLTYSVLSFPSGAGSATYNTAGLSTFSFIWGSPDSYNSVTFNGVGAGGTFSLAQLPHATPDVGFDLVTFALSGVSTVTFNNTGQSAFEFADVSQVPIPPSLLLIAGGLGLLGFFGLRKKRQAGGLELSAAA
jgi:hypothetical protein